MSDRQEVRDRETAQPTLLTFEPELWYFDAALLAVSLCSLAIGFGLS